MIEVAAGKPIWAIGMMSGTSMDGMDIALLRTDGERLFDFGPSMFVPVWPNLKDALQSRLSDIAALEDRTWLDPNLSYPEWLGELEHFVTGFHEWAFHGFQCNDALAGNEFRLLADLTADECCIGVHGQTVLHRPEQAYTVQLFENVHLGRWETISDFRSADINAGGQGAPLAPFYHFALAKHVGATAPVVFLNIGGVANITWVDPGKEKPEEDGALLAFDTGPGNALVNDWMKAQTGADYDTDGAAAAAGRVHRDRLNTNSGAEYLRRPGPKSLDRNDFHGVLAAMEGLSVDDGAATLTQFTADCVAASVRHMPSPPSRWLVCGGGRLNKTMMAMLAGKLDAPVDPVEAVGLDGDMLEAQAFAYLAVRVLRGLPTSAPSTTGCREPVCGGRISYPNK